MNKSSAIDVVGHLMLARLLVAGEKGATRSELKKTFEPLLGHRFTGPALVDRLAGALAGLETAALVHRTRKGKTERGTLTEEGKRRALEFLGLDHLPPRMNWSQITKSYLTARALGLPTPKDKAVKLIGGDPGFKAALLKSLFDLPLDDYSTFDQALDALSWRLLGFEADRGTKFTLKAVKAALIGRAVEDRKRVDPKADPRTEAVKLLAREVGARQSGPGELRNAALRRWIDGIAPAPKPAPTPPLDLDTFSRRVLEAARSCRTGRFGDDKVFVIHVFQSLSGDPAIASLGLDGFKEWLAKANNARRLDLGRADMVEAMDPEDVVRSKVTNLGAEYHFVRI